MRKKLLGLVLTLVMVVSLAPVMQAGAAPAAGGEFDSLLTPKISWVLTASSGGEYYMAYVQDGSDLTNNIKYYTGSFLAPQNINQQYIRIGVPKAYLNSDGTINPKGEVNGFTASTAPIVMTIGNSGHAGTNVGYPDTDRIKIGFISVNVGNRGRDTLTNGFGNNKLPYIITDLKSVVRWLKLNDSVIPGNVDRICHVGSSGGGSTSSALGGSGNMPIFFPSLYEVGAAGIKYIGKGDPAIDKDPKNYVSTISDQTFGAAAFCPIQTLDTADMAYAWFRNPTTQLNAKIGNYFNDNALQAGVTGALMRAIEEDLYWAYIGYINELFAGTGLYLAPDGRGGTFYQGVLDTITYSLNTHYKSVFEDAAIRTEEIKKLPSYSEYLVIDEAKGEAKVTDMDAFILHVMPIRNKWTPAFDIFAYADRANPNSGTSNSFYLYGRPAADNFSYSHYSVWDASVLQANYNKDAGTYKNNDPNINGGEDIILTDVEKYFIEAYIQDCFEDADTAAYVAEQVFMLNAVNMAINNTDIAPYWRIRHGIQDEHTSFSVSYSLARMLEIKQGVNVDYALTWGVTHGASEGSGYSTVNKWFEKITKEANAKIVDVKVSAFVTKLNGNKNDLTITVTEFRYDGKTNIIKQTFSINNNAADTYNVGPYKVYVDTKGNDQIRACYIVK